MEQTETIDKLENLRDVVEPESPEQEENLLDLSNVSVLSKDSSVVVRRGSHGKLTILPRLTYF